MNEPPPPFQILFLRGITMKQFSLWSSDFLDLFRSCFDLPIKVTMPPSFYWWQAMVVEQCNLVKDVLTHSRGLHLMVFKGPSQPKPVWFCDLLTGIWNSLEHSSLYYLGKFVMMTIVYKVPKISRHFLRVCLAFGTHWFAKNLQIWAW